MTLEIHYNVYGCFRSPREDIELAKEAIDAGFEGIWIGDHFMPWLDSRPFAHHPFPWFGTLMSEIPGVPVGTSITCPMLRYRPPLIAQAIATLDNMYPGRFNLGVGVGEALNEAHFCDGDWPDWNTRVGMLIESIEIMRRLWTTDGYITYDGEHFQYDGIKLYTQSRERIPIHWAGWGPTSCEYAGRFADHLLTVAGPDQIANTIVPNFQQGLERSKRSMENVDISTEYSVAVGDPHVLVSDIRERGEYVPHTTELDNPDPRSIQRTANARLQEMSETEIQEAANITDDPEDIVADLRAVSDAGVTRVLVGSTCGDPHRIIDAFEEYVFPRFN